MIRLIEVLTISLGQTPQMRLLEGNICRNYYRQYDSSVIDLNDDIPEELCKIAEVQAQVSHITGLANIFNLIPGMSNPVSRIFSTLRDQSSC